MTTDIATQDNAALLEQVVVKGDLSKLTPTERTTYYAKVCESVGLNPLTQPFEYITLNGRMVLYASKRATEQLTAKLGLSLTIQEPTEVKGAYVVRAVCSDGAREVSASGVVDLGTLKGDALANAMMKAETKACRRAVLRFTGLGMLDEMEVETIQRGRPLVDAAEMIVDEDTGKTYAVDPLYVDEEGKLTQKKYPEIASSPVKAEIEVLPIDCPVCGVSWRYDPNRKYVYHEGSEEGEEMTPGPCYSEYLEWHPKHMSNWVKKHSPEGNPHPRRYLVFMLDQEVQSKQAEEAGNE